MAKNKWVAAFLSLLVCGLGQLYLGLYWSALFFFSLELLTVAIYNYSATTGLFFNVIVSFWSGLHAYHAAKNRDKIQIKEIPAASKLKLF